MEVIRNIKRWEKYRKDELRIREKILQQKHQLNLKVPFA